MLLPELAEKIVKEVQKLISEEIIVVNTAGVIIAGTSLERVGSFHEGAKLAIQQKKKRIITEEAARKLKGVKAGINLPIFFQNEVIGVIGITGEPEAVTPFGEIVRKMTELWIRENYYAEQFDWHSRALESFVMEWVQAKEASALPADRARVLSIHLELTRTAAIVEFEPLSQPLSRDIWSSIFQSLSDNQQDVIARSGNERVILLFDCSNSQTQTDIKRRIEAFLSFLKASFGLTAYAGIGQKTEAGALYESYRQAERALQAAKRKGRIVFDEELTIEMLSGELSQQVKSEYISRTIGPLLQETELLDTLTELFRQNHSLKKTAESLHIHINTLHYRLKKVEESTKLNPGDIHDLMCLYLAVLFHTEDTIG